MSSYVRLCNCDLKLEDDSQIEVHLCQTCGKRAGKGRDGSITQFVFRSDTCSCDVPKVFTEQIDKAAKPIPYDHSDKEEESEEEIPVNPENFPVDRYKPLQILGRGGNSVVYLARDRLLKVKVAVKVLHMLEGRQLIMFQEEAKATSKIKHKNIIEILNFGATKDGAPYMILEYFPGISAEERLNEATQLQAEEAKLIIEGVAQALSFAHQRGVFHRDLKPANILIGTQPDGKKTIKLIDFGIASVQESTQETTEYQGRTLAGTPNYMSPDLLKGEAYTEASEVYSLGCVFYHLLAGQPVFSGDTALDILSKHANSEPRSVNELCKTDPPAKVSEIIDKCLAKDPHNRYANMDALLEALNFELTSENTEVPVETSVTNKKKFPVLASFIGLVVLLFFSISCYWLFKKEKDPERKSSTKIQKSRSKIVDSTIVNLLDDDSKFRKDSLNSSLYQNFTAKTPSKFSDQDLVNLSKYRNIIRGLDISEANITDNGMKHLKNLNLTHLKLEGTAITSEAALYIKDIKQLSDLTVSSTKFGDKGFEQLENKLIYRIGANHCPNLTDRGLTTIVKKWPGLLMLDISNTKVSKEGLLQIEKLKRLKHLSISGMPVSKKLAKILSRSNIVYLNVALAQITEEEMDIIATMPKLESLAAINSIPNLAQWTEKTHKKRPDLDIFNTANMNSKKLPPPKELDQFMDFINPDGIHD